ncbi:unnamed protein product [marine sediment metagenome]|uniref:Methyltransferase type 11 domain-containing protein n=1 Tax=marine sediment metagenome TaxID=412755 RepID=X0U673_9ZZZZ
MHHMQNLFIEKMKEEHPEYFENVKVLDVGSLDVNGNNSMFFKNSEYTGIDVIKGANVDIISPLHLWKTKRRFDTIISTSALEHDMYIIKTITRIYELLKPGGWLFIVACRSWRAHGTKNNGPDNAGNSQIENDNWCNYYANVKVKDLKQYIKQADVEFENIEIIKSPNNKDTRFCGQKPGIWKPSKIIKDNIAAHKSTWRERKAGQPIIYLKNEDREEKKKPIIVKRYKFTEFNIGPGMQGWDEKPEEYKLEYFDIKNVNRHQYKMNQKNTQRKK